MPFADKKTWENTRTKVCEGSGVGKACDAWKVACTEPAKIAADKAKTGNALKAINQMYAALKVAQGKLAKAPKDDKKKAATETLIAQWEKDTRDYQNKLNAAVLASVGDELKGKIDAAKKEISLMLAESDRQLKEVIPALLDKAEAFLKKNDAPGAETQLQNANGKLKYAALTASHPEEMIGTQEKKAGLTPGKLTAKDFAPQLNAAKGMIKALYKRAADLEREMDEIDDGPSAATAKTDPEYKKRFDTVLKAYNSTLKEIQQGIAEAQQLQTKCVAFNGNPLLQSNPEGMLKVASNMHEAFERLKSESAAALHAIRESTGKVVKLRVASNLDKEDVAKLQPLMTRGMTLNSRIIAASIKGMTEVREGLETIVAGKDAKAAKAAKALLDKF